MSVTAVLVPVDEPECEALLQGGSAAAKAEAAVRERAAVLRARVARVDAIRESVHELLFDRWQASLPREPGWAGRVARLLLSSGKVPEGAPRSSGYDPLVQIFGRSFPVNGDPQQVAATLQRLVALPEADFDAAMEQELRTLDARAAAAWREARPAPVADVEAAVQAQVDSIRRTVQEGSETLKPAWDALVRLSAWSRPVWRLDGILLQDLLRVAGAETEAGRASPLFEELFAGRPDLAPLAGTLPAQLPDFRGGGAFLASIPAKTLARALQLKRKLVARNVADSGEDEAAAMRNVRLLEEALLCCEAGGFGLAEGAGVEWHDRSAAA